MLLEEEQPDFDSNYETSINMLNNSESVKDDKVKPTPLPLSQVVCVLLIQLCEAININVLFPFLAFMVEDLGYGGNMLGVYAGGLGAAFCFAQFSSSIIWGIVSDHYGRKPAIIIGTIGAAVGMLVFGFSVTYWQAVLGRALSGFLSGNLGVLKTYLTEITDDSNRGYGFSLMSLSWSIGTIIAPLAGGWLCKPTEKYPTLFSPNGLFGKFPYLLPSLVCVAFSVVSVISCLVLMKDTVNREINDKQLNKSNPFFLLSSKSRKGLSNVSNQTYSPISDDDKDPDIERSVESNDVETEKSIDSDNNDNIITSKQKQSHNSMIDEEGIELTALPINKITIQANEIHSKKKKKQSNIMSRFFQLFNRKNNYSNNSSKNNKKPTKIKILSDPLVLLSTSLYGTLCMSYILLEETLPLYLKLDQLQGGFSFSSTEIGILLSCGGLLTMGFTLFALPYIAKLSKKKIFSMSIYLGIPVAFAWPLVAYINFNNRYKYLIFVLLIICFLVKNTLSTVSFTASIIMVNHSVENKYLGAVNGLGQSFGSLARGVGPAVGGILWSLGLQIKCTIFNFIAFSVGLLVCEIMNYNLPSSIDTQKRNESDS
mmetsp:Transcript_17937/g.16211  ORF Transcript_17937/g.16211 Transcript_17937/m.16211 type:complete len:597 (-) Transcript_17937:1080-2870(-)